MGELKSRWFGLGATVCGVLLIGWAFSPPYSFHPLCTYDLTYRLKVTLEAGGKQYSSEVVRQHSYSRIDLFSADCKAAYGTALGFRLDDNRLVMLPTHICQTANRRIADLPGRPYDTDAARAMKQHRKVDVTSFCTGVMRDHDRSMPNFLKYDGFLVDNADKPSQWIGFRFDDRSGPAAQFRIVSAIAEAADISPTDNLDKIAPGIFKTEFNRINADWSDSPESLISLSRRYSRPTFVAYQR
jgi:hypothetical protein